MTLEGCVLCVCGRVRSRWGRSDRRRQDRFRALSSFHVLVRPAALPPLRLRAGMSTDAPPARKVFGSFGDSGRLCAPPRRFAMRTLDTPFRMRVAPCEVVVSADVCPLAGMVTRKTLFRMWTRRLVAFV